MKELIEINITETGRGSLKEKPYIFNKEKKIFGITKEVMDFLIERYGKIPKMKNKIYRDTKEGSVEVGFAYSFWDKDISHNSKNWYQTDWIEIRTIKYGFFDFKKLKW